MRDADIVQCRLNSTSFPAPYTTNSGSSLVMTRVSDFTASRRNLGTVNVPRCAGYSVSNSATLKPAWCRMLLSGTDLYLDGMNFRQ